VAGVSDVCGIAGHTSLEPIPPELVSQLATRMSNTMVHRGPDDAGFWNAPDYRTFLVHRRLSVIDLSGMGRNPMAWEEGRLRITYNGEVYNFRELRGELESLGCRFRTQTDTEVILAAYNYWGPGCLSRLVGMFAFAIWDESRRRLFLARDRFGKKPLYMWLRREGLSFASELKALASDPEFPRELDKSAVGLYLRYGYVPAPFSIFRGVRKLPPGCFAVYESGQLTTTRYWDPIDRALCSKERISPEEADIQIERLLKEAVRGRLISDVPVGAFLSGGIDSSLVVAMMQESCSERVRTFTIRFENPEYDESAHAAAVARHLGTEHHEETCGSAEMLDVVERLPDVFDEPFGDSSAIPTYVVSRITRQRVTVALSGDGGDEIFLGYPRYLHHARSGWLTSAPRIFRRTVAGAAAAIPWRRVRRVADVLRDDQPDIYARFITTWSGDDLNVLYGPTPEAPAYKETYRKLGASSRLQRAPLLDIVSYLPDDILTKVDRASMAVSLETRCPFLDHRLAEYALRLPVSLKTDGRLGKLPLRRLLSKRLPHELTNRPKRGFGVPLEDWFRGPLRERMAEYLSGRDLVELGLNPEPGRRLWQDFLRGRSHRADRLWNLFVLIAWAKRWRPLPVRDEVTA